jgi:hypothetical protein
MKTPTSLKIIVTLLSVLIVCVGFVKFKYGTGKEYPDLGSALPTEAFTLEKVIQLDYPPGNLAVADNGDVYFNYHPLANAERFSPASVFKWSDGKMEPFPSLEAQKNFQGTFGMTIDKQGRIWFIEPVSLDLKHARISAFDLNTKNESSNLSFRKGKRRLQRIFESRRTANMSSCRIPASSGSRPRVLSSILYWITRSIRSSPIIRA